MIKLSDISTKAPKNLEKAEIKEKTKELAKEIGELVYKMYAEKKHSLLIVLQGMDSSGKDGIVKNVFKYCMPLHVDAHSFKKPTEEEFAHDFLWRCHKLTPAKGEVSIFVRSHYEDILIQKVHNWISDERRDLRMQAINSFEKLVTFDNNTTVMKFFLHLSKDRQEEKLRERINIADKHFKHNDGDWDERKHWDEYMKAYEYAINHSEIPWNIVPVDSRWYRNYRVAQIVLEKLRELDPQLPGLDSERFKPSQDG